MPEPKIERYPLEAGEGLPNNRWPLVVYRGALSGAQCSALGCAGLFRGNGWQGTWVNGVFAYWHYHMHAHEVLGVIGGGAEVGFGGDGGVVAAVSAGDVVVIPAGVGHKRMSQQAGFRVVGGYPPGQDGAVTDAGEVALDAAIEATAVVPVPATDPVWGAGRGLPEIWR